MLFHVSTCRLISFILFFLRERKQECKWEREAEGEREQDPCLMQGSIYNPAIITWTKIESNTQMTEPPRPPYFIIFNSCLHECLLFHGGYVPPLQVMRETTDGTKPCIYYIFSRMNIPMIKCNLYIKHSRRLKTIINNMMEQLYPHTVIEVMCMWSLSHSLSKCLTVPYCPSSHVGIRW